MEMCLEGVVLWCFANGVKFEVKPVGDLFGKREVHLELVKTVDGRAYSLAERLSDKDLEWAAAGDRRVLQHFIYRAVTTFAHTLMKDYGISCTDPNTYVFPERTY